MRHAVPDDLRRVNALLDHLREQPELTERKPGNFSRGGRAFLHFHVDGDDVYVDVKLGPSFERVKVTRLEEQETLLAQIRKELHPET